MMRICHMTSAHPWNDVRIFLKECQSLAAAGYEVYLVAEGVDREEGGVHVIGCGAKPSGRRERMGQFAEIVYEKARALNCDIYHFHDPELLLYGLKLKREGKKVIFDSHEDVPGQILDKEWIPWMLRKVISVAYRVYETYCVKRFDAVVAATPHIAELFSRRAKRVIDVNNFPKLDDIIFHEKNFRDREAIVCYAGGINKLRGESIMLDVMRDIKGKLVMAGAYDKEGLYREKGKNVEYLGILDRAGVNNVYGRAVLGLVLLLPNPNYVWSRPIKMYEYMAAGLPFVCSDFPLWKAVAEETGAGVCVSLDDIKGIRKAVRSLLENREKAQEMGRRGRKYVMEKCNWANEERKLIELYRELE